MKPTASPCVTCPHREGGFCGTLLHVPSPSSGPAAQRDWQRFFAAKPSEQIATRNQTSADVFVLCTGWAFRFLQLPNGRRQILKFLLPGDLFSTTSIFEDQFHFSAKAVTAVQVSALERSAIRLRCAENPDIWDTISRSCVEDSHMADELTCVLGQRSAEERIAYLFLHLMRRIEARSVVRDRRYPLPLRQQHVADAVGLTSVHVSRVLSLFRDRGVCDFSENVLAVRNPTELNRIGSLD